MSEFGERRGARPHTVDVMQQNANGAGATEPQLDHDLCYRALLARDARYDGRFFTCVRSTGVYCRPVCPARTPQRRNCHFVPSAAAAEAAGYRACLRCRPETAPGTPAWSGTAAIVARALRLIDMGALDASGVGALAARLGIGERQLRRLFVAHLGAGPLAVAANRRLLTAKQLITETQIPLTEVAEASGYRSLRRFHGAVRAAYGVAPTAIRRATAVPAGGTLRLRLGYRPPFDWPRLLAFLATRAIPGVESVDGTSYRRSFRIGDAAGTVCVAPARDNNAIEVTICPVSGGRPSATPVRSIVARLRRLFDLNADPGAIRDALHADPHIGSRLARAPGLRVPGAFTGFELAVRAVLGQQISVRAATTLAGRIAREMGSPCESEVAGINRLFPEPEAFLAEGLSSIGLTEARIETLRGLARAVQSGAIDFEPGAGLDETVRKLSALPGIGAWTAHYIALRAVGEPDAFPASDLGLRKAVGGTALASPRDLEAMSQTWRPWRGYAALALWTIEGGADETAD